MGAVIGQHYTCKSSASPDCVGQTYAVRAVATAVPEYQEKVVVEGVDGPDRGRWFVMSVNRFERMFIPKDT